MSFVYQWASFQSSEHTLVPINKNIKEVPFYEMNIIDLSMMTSLNESYNFTNSPESYGNEHGDQSSYLSSDSFSHEI